MHRPVRRGSRAPWSKTPGGNASRRTRSSDFDPSPATEPSGMRWEDTSTQASSPAPSVAGRRSQARSLRIPEFGRVVGDVGSPRQKRADHSSPPTIPVSPRRITFDAVDDVKHGRVSLFEVNRERIGGVEASGDEEHPFGEKVPRDPRHTRELTDRARTPSPRRIEVLHCENRKARFVEEVIVRNEAMSRLEDVIRHLNTNRPTDVDCLGRVALLGDDADATKTGDVVSGCGGVVRPAPLRTGMQAGHRISPRDFDGRAVLLNRALRNEDRALAKTTDGLHAVGDK